MNMNQNKLLVTAGPLLRACLPAVALLLVSPAPVSAEVTGGWADINGATTGGAGGPTVTVTTDADFRNYIAQAGPYVVQVSGTINLGATSARSASNKSIIGLGTNAQIVGNLEFSGVSNCIVKNITFTNPGGAGQGDGVTSQLGSDHLWFDHCTFFDCADGNLDITKQSDYVTVSWCEFYYTFDSGHNFSNLIGSSDTDTADRGKLRQTWHHNWWSTLCKERMPRVRFGQVHLYNNYYAAPANNYNIGVGVESQIRVENNYWESQNNAWKDYYTGFGAAGKILWNAGNVFVSTAIPTWAANDTTVFTPPYAYTLDAGADVKALVMAGAGAGVSTTPPAAPGSLTATAASSSQINLAWTDNANNEDGFKIERSPDNVAFTQIATTGANSTSYADTNRACSTLYYYRVRSYNASGDSAYSNTANATTTAVPPVPAGLSATAGNARVDLSWAAAAGAGSYNVKRSTTSGGPYTTIATGVTGTTYADTTVSNGTTYYYVVSAVNACAESANSSQVSATPTAPTGPAAPTGLTATAGKRKITINWTDNSNNETGFKIERSLDGVAFTQITTVAANTIS